MIVHDIEQSVEHARQDLLVLLDGGNESVLGVLRLTSLHALTKPILSEDLLTAILSEHFSKLMSELLLPLLHLLHIKLVVLIDDIVGEVHKSILHFTNDLFAVIVELLPVEVYAKQRVVNYFFWSHLLYMG